MPRRVEMLSKWSVAYGAGEDAEMFFRRPGQVLTQATKPSVSAAAAWEIEEHLAAGRAVELEGVVTERAVRPRGRPRKR